MCVICLEFQRTKDLADARMMLQSARREPTSIPREHLEEVESELAKLEKQIAASQKPAKTP